ncbi:MAG: Phosphoglycolate phosphatase [Syntrophus sp. SKADARSKE-3]|nr:Phosphoglycolate phosphatase [Syntrophus sp. SKADARSKE-3]
MTQKLFLFDFDGVLVDSLQVYLRAVKWCLETIGSPIVKTEEDYRDLFDDNFYESLQQRGVDLDAFGKALLDYTAMMGGNYYDDVTPFTLMIPIVEALRKNHLLAIISSNSLDAIEKIFKKFQYDGCFQTILGSDFSLSKKDKIAYAMDRFSVGPENTYYVGDTAGDITEGRQAGVLTVAVTWGWHSRTRLLTANPDFLVDVPEELLAV